MGVLRKHKLTHLPVLRVGRSIRDARMLATCCSNRCVSTCCETGVLMDRADHARILAHVPEIHRAMDADMEKNPAKWFDASERKDPDFPSGVAIGTRATRRGCVFLNRERLCVLQKAHADGLVATELKPFYCFAFPITVDQGTLSLDIHGVDGSTSCCVPSPEGERHVLDAFAWELEHVLGKEGLDELRALIG